MQWDLGCDGMPLTAQAPDSCGRLGVSGSNSLSPPSLMMQVLTLRKLTTFCGPSSWPAQGVATDRRQGTTRKAVTMATGSISLMAWSEEWIRLWTRANVVGWSGLGSYLFIIVMWNQLKCSCLLCLWWPPCAWFPACMLAVCTKVSERKRKYVRM